MTKAQRQAQAAQQRRRAEMEKQLAAQQEAFEKRKAEAAAKGDAMDVSVNDFTMMLKNSSLIQNPMIFTMNLEFRDLH